MCQFNPKPFHFKMHPSAKLDLRDSGQKTLDKIIKESGGRRWNPSIDYHNYYEELSKKWKRHR